LQLSGDLNDYLGTPYVLDIMNHNVRAPCPVCSFRYRTGDASEVVPKYCYSTKIHCCHSSFVRGLFRTLSIRSSNLHQNDLLYMGMKHDKDEQIQKNGNWPPLKLSIALKDVIKSIPLTDDGQRVIPGFLDPYTMTIVAPDHCLSGLVSKLLEVLLIQMESRKMQESLNIRVCCTIRLMGINGQSSIFNNDYSSVNSLPMSDLDGILIVLPSIIETIGLKDSCPSYGMINEMKKLVAMAYW